MGIFDRATECEEKERERAIAVARLTAGATRDYESEICIGCTYATRTNFGKGCEAWAECLSDLQKRERAGK